MANPSGYQRKSLRLGPTQLAAVGTSDVSICTPDVAGKVYTIKHIQATNNDAAATHYLCIAIGANTAANRIVDQVAIPANGEYARFVIHILGNSDTNGLCPGADTASKITLTINGILETISS